MAAGLRLSASAGLAGYGLLIADSYKMRISPNWLREFVSLTIDDARLAEDLTHAGIAVESVTGEGADIVFEMDITTNRVDAMNHYGVARECSAIYDLDLKPIAPKLPQVKEPTSFPLEIRESQLCARYTARAIRDVRIEKSPRYISERLLIDEHHGINNVADITNYVLMEMGKPTHAFDLDRLEGRKIIVRLANSGEKLKTLDGVERTLQADDLVIADAVRPVALAGVMGGWDSMITSETRNILIESAWFDPSTVRRTARRQGMHTDASHRFERGADWGATALAADRVAELVLETGGGKLAEYNDAIARNPKHAPVQLDHEEILRILGQDIPQARIEQILRRLGFVLTPHGRSSSSGSSGSASAVATQPDSYSVEIPTWRMDVEREIDIIEEVARVYGFNNFANTLPAYSGSVIEQPNAKAESKMRSRLLALGYDEAVSPTFISAADAELFSKAKPVALENPLSDEAPLLRNSLLPGMLGMLTWNFNRGTNDLRLFETGNVFALAGDRVTEQRQLCFAASGSTGESGSLIKPRFTDFFDLKGDVEALLDLFGSEAVEFAAPGPEYYHPGRSSQVSLNGIVVGELGQLHPDIAGQKKFKQEIWLACFDLDGLFGVQLREPRYERLSRYPAVERDFSLLLDNGITYERLRTAVNAIHISELRSIEPHEVFRGSGVPDGKYSLLLRVKFQSSERTLRDDEVAAWSAQIIRAVESLGGALRA